MKLKWPLVKKIVLSLLLFSVSVFKSQNLISNGSFETYSTCPYLNGNFILPTGWLHPVKYYTPDYFNSCSSNGQGVPSNVFGFQNAQHGDAYLGIVNFELKPTIDYREYIEVRLNTSLQSGQCYRFQMFLNLGETFSRYTTSTWGVYLSNTLVFDSISSGPLSLTPQIVPNSPVYPDSSSWRLTTGDFIANGGEEYLVIGNFAPAINDTLLADTNVSWRGSYFFIDNVSLKPCNSNGSEQFHRDDGVSVFPNPFTTALNIQLPLKEKTHFQIFNSLAQIIVDEWINDYAVIDTGPYQPGIYYYRLVLNTGKQFQGKVIKK